MVTDLTVGNPMKILWKFTLPMLISIIFQQMYNLADSIIAGNFIGTTPIENENALAAVGASFSITMLFMNIAAGINAGCSVVISQLFGAKKFTSLKTAVSTALITTTVAALVLAVVGYFSCDGLLVLLKTPDAIMVDSAIYLNIYFFGLPFLFLYNACTGIFTALGDSRTPLVFLIASSIGNVILNIVFVIVFDMGIAGIAWATFIAQGISSIFAFIWLIKRVKSIKAEEKPMRYSFDMLKTICRISVPTIFQLSFVSVGNLFVQSLMNEMGAPIIAGYSAALRLLSLATSCIICMSNGYSSFVAQNIGAGKISRIPEGFRATVKFSTIATIPFVIAFFIFSEQMITLFMPSPTKEAMEAGQLFLISVAPFYFVLMFKVIADSVLKGAGSMRQFMFTTLIDLIIRVSLSYILAPFVGFLAICIAWILGWIVGTAFSIIFYLKGDWKDLNFISN